MKLVNKCLVAFALVFSGSWALATAIRQLETFNVMPEVPSALELAKKNVVRFDSYINGDKEGSCSGTVIDSVILVSAAHCVPQPPPQIVAMAKAMGVVLPPPTFKLSMDHTAMVPNNVDNYIDVSTFNGHFAIDNKVAVDSAQGLLYETQVAVLCGYPAFNKTLRCTRATRVKNHGFAALFDTVIIPGQSGGAVFTEDGVLIGIIQGVTEEGLSYTTSTTGMLSSEKNQAYR